MVLVSKVFIARKIVLQLVQKGKRSSKAFASRNPLFPLSSLKYSTSVRRISVYCFSGGEKRRPEIRLRLQARVLKTCWNLLTKTKNFFSLNWEFHFIFSSPVRIFPILYSKWNTTILIITLAILFGTWNTAALIITFKHLRWLTYARMSIERFRIAFTVNGKGQFVPRDQFPPLLVVYRLLYWSTQKWVVSWQFHP